MSLQRNAVFSKRNSLICVQGHRLKREGRQAARNTGEKKNTLMKGMKNASTWQIYGTGYASDKLKVGMMVVMTTH